MTDMLFYGKTSARLQALFCNSLGHASLTLVYAVFDLVRNDSPES